MNHYNSVPKSTHARALGICGPKYGGGRLHGEWVLTQNGHLLGTVTVAMHTCISMHVGPQYTISLWAYPLPWRHFL